MRIHISVQYIKQYLQTSLGIITLVNTRICIKYVPLQFNVGALVFKHLVTSDHTAGTFELKITIRTSGSGAYIYLGIVHTHSMQGGLLRSPIER
jgi:hypothetical protein